MEGLTWRFIVSGSNVLIEKECFVDWDSLNYQSFLVHWYMNTHSIVEGKGWYPGCARLSSARILLALKPGQSSYENINLDPVNVYKLPSTHSFLGLRLIIMQW